MNGSANTSRQNVRMLTGGQSYVERPSVRALVGLVSSVWVQLVRDDAAPYEQRHIPNGSVELSCILGSNPRVVGPLTEPLIEILPPGTAVVGLRFRPGAASAVLGLPASELTDQIVPADALWGRGATAIGERMAETTTAEAALAVLQQVIVDTLADAEAPDPMVAGAVRLLQSGADVGTLVRSLHISERHLRRRCQVAVGLAPKPLHRLLRFQTFLAISQQAMAQAPVVAKHDLALRAARAGYADQSHLTRECVRLTGVAPGAFLKAAQQTCACGHDHAASFVPVLAAALSDHAGAVNMQPAVQRRHDTPRGV